MKINIDWLKEKNACSEGIKWFMNQDKIDSIQIITEFIEIKKHLDWGNWLIIRTMSYKQYTDYALFAAESVLPIYEKKYLNDKRVRECIQGVKDYLHGKINQEKLKKLRAATYVADAAAAAADAAAAYAAAAAADAAAADAGYAYAAAADAAAYAAAYAAQKMEIKILKYGIRIIAVDEESKKSSLEEIH